jgi:hypothetical protein
MGIYDYENYSSRLSVRKKSVVVDGVTTKVNMSLLEEMQNNQNFLKKFLDATSILNDYTNKFNRPLFKITHLREDIYFINCLVTNQKTNIVYPFVFAVNAKTIYKRFKVFYGEDSQEYFTSKTCTVSDYLYLMINSTNRVTVNFWSSELTLIASHSSDSEPTTDYNKFAFTNNQNVHVTWFEHYNKRMWIALLNDTDLNDFTTSSGGSTYNDDLAKTYS